VHPDTPAAAAGGAACVPSFVRVRA
jgi:hypothetical protein